MTTATKHPRLVSAVLLLLTLAAGFAGGLAWRSGDADPAPAEANRSRDGGRERRSLVIHEIGLDPATRAKVDDIIDHFGAQMRALDREFEEQYRPRQRALIAQARDSIRSVLTPAQVVAYDSLLSARYDGRGRDRGRPPRGSGRSHDDRRSPEDDRSRQDAQSHDDGRRGR